MFYFQFSKLLQNVRFRRVSQRHAHLPIYDREWFVWFLAILSNLFSWPSIEVLIQVIERASFWLPTIIDLFRNRVQRAKITIRTPYAAYEASCCISWNKTNLLTFCGFGYNAKSLSLNCAQVLLLYLTVRSLHSRCFYVVPLCFSCFSKAWSGFLPLKQYLTWMSSNTYFNSGIRAQKIKGAKILVLRIGIVVLNVTKKKELWLMHLCFRHDSADSLVADFLLFTAFPATGSNW